MEAPGGCDRRGTNRRGRRRDPCEGRGRDLLDRAQARQRQALWRRYPAVHGGGVRPPAGHHRPEGHEDENDIAVEHGDGHRQTLKPHEYIGMVRREVLDKIHR